MAMSMGELRSGDQYPQVQQLLGPRVPLETVLYSYGPRGHELLMYYRGPTARESHTVRRAELSLALVVDQPLLVLLFRFGNQEWSAAPGLALARPRSVDVALSVLLVDAARTAVVTARRLYMPPEFAAGLAEHLAEQIAYRPTAAELQERLRALRARIGHDRNLLTRAVVRCTTSEDQSAGQTMPNGEPRGSLGEHRATPPAVASHESVPQPGNRDAAVPAADDPAEAQSGDPQSDEGPETTWPGQALAQVADGVHHAILASEHRPARIMAALASAPADPAARQASHAMPAALPAALEGPDEFITLARAAELSGLAPDTLRSQATRRGQKLRVVRLGPRALVTTRRWLHEYLVARDARGGHASIFPQGYRPPE